MTQILDHLGNPISLSAGNNSYTGAKQDRLWSNWNAQNRSGDSAINEDWDILNSRMRDLFRNDGVMKNAKRAIAKHVIGAIGIQTFADARITRGSGGDYDDEFNFQSDDEFEEWAEFEADVEGRMSWPQMQWLHFNEVMETGSSLLLQCVNNDPDRSVPVCYQLLEAEQIDRSIEFPTNEKGVRCEAGIEYDRFNREVGFWLFDVHPHGSATTGFAKSGWVPADRVIHSYMPNRTSEHRGVTWFASNVQSSKDLDWYIGNELTAAALGALLTLIHKKENPSDGFNGGAGGPSSTSGNVDDYSNPLTKMGRGTVATIGINESIEVAQSERPNRDAAPFIKLILSLQAMGAGISQLRLTGDYSQSSYTSARGAHLDDQAYFQVLQEWAARSFVRKVRRVHTREAVLFGRLNPVTPKQFKDDRRNFQRLIIQPPGREQLDPEKETGAAKERIAAGFSTHQIECGLKGRHWRRIIWQRKREIAEFESAGFEPDLGHSAQYLTSREERKAQEQTSNGVEDA